MAERRMFAKTIIDSDAFLNMPQSSQLLYFHLAMGADDDGFINKPKTIMLICGCKDDDMKLLISKEFIIWFDSGVAVIKHWKIHNYIAKDRYNETKYKQEKATLMLDENKTYTSRIQGVDDMDTQVRLGEDRLEKDSIGKSSKGKDWLEDISGDISMSSEDTYDTPKSPEKTDYRSIVERYNSICSSFPKIKSLSSDRKKAIKARLNTYTVEQLEEVFRKAEASNFLKGANNRNWSANFDWLIKDMNIAKVLDGNYDNKEVQIGYSAGTTNYTGEDIASSYDLSFINRV